MTDSLRREFYLLQALTEVALETLDKLCTLSLGRGEGIECVRVCVPYVRAIAAQQAMSLRMLDSRPVWPNIRIWMHKLKRQIL